MNLIEELRAAANAKFTPYDGAGDRSRACQLISNLRSEC